MTRPLALPQNQAETLMRAAKKQGVRLEVKIGDAVITVIPDTNPQDQRLIDEEEDIRL